MFDPEKVERHDCGYEDGMLLNPEGGYVFWEDYDKLLELYRKQAALLERLDRACLVGCLSLPEVRDHDPQTS